MVVYQYKQGDRPLDGYTIDYALGRGGFGEVYFAHSDAGREVALKAIQNHEDTELRGIGHCMNLKSPHLVMIFDVKQGDDGTPWVIMEYVSGACLREILDENPNGIGEDQAVFFLRELAKGIQYLHNAGVVHRDLKPHNVFFEDGVVKVGDYSLSKAISHSHRSGHTTTVGSVHYMAPEISMGRYDKTVDIYALGIIFYEMLVGEPPYTGQSIGEVLMKHLNAELNLSKIPKRYAPAISKALAKDPEKRYQSVDEMVADVTGNHQEPLAMPVSLSMIGTQHREPTRVPQVLSDTMSVANETSDTKPKSNPKCRGGPPNLFARRKGNETRGPANPAAVSEERIPNAILSFFCAFFLIGVCSPFESATTYSESWEPRASSFAYVFIAIIWTWLFSLGNAFFQKLLLPSDRKGWRWAIFSRLISAAITIPFAVLIASAQGPPNAEFFVMMFVGVGISMLVFDWRKFANRSRRRRLLPLSTLAIGIVSGVSILPMNHIRAPVFYAAAMAISAAITVQLTTPWNVRPNTDSISSGDGSPMDSDADLPQPVRNQRHAKSKSLDSDDASRNAMEVTR